MHGQRTKCICRAMGHVGEHSVGVWMEISIQAVQITEQSGLGRCRQLGSDWKKCVGWRKGLSKGSEELNLWASLLVHMRTESESLELYLGG
jgi:hypothetical protein